MCVMVGKCNCVFRVPWDVKREILRPIEMLYFKICSCLFLKISRCVNFDSSRILFLNIQGVPDQVNETSGTYRKLNLEQICSYKHKFENTLLKSYS